MESYSDVWNGVLEVFKNAVENEKITEVAYTLWIEPLQLLKLDSTTASLGISDFKIKFVNDRYLGELESAFEQVLGFKIKVEVVPVDTVAETHEKSEEFPSEFDYTFDSFIVGPSNKFAYAAAKAVAKNPGSVYNPLFLHGRSGLGKTHLLCAIQKEIEKNTPNAKIVYTSGENFTNELISYLAEKNMTEFHNKYRSADVLLVDDVQFIAGKIQTQEEFFHTFDSLNLAGKQIVLTSDRPPKEMQTLEERLRTRFEWGLLADVQPPDLETRMAIIKRKAQLLNLDLNDEVVEFIADKLKNNIRQLEGAVKKINAMRVMNNSVPSIVLANDAIKDILTYNQPVSVTVNKIIEQVARTFGVSPEDIKSQKKKADISNARQISIYIIREITELPHEAIGKFFNKNHSTIIYSYDIIKTKMEENSSLKNMVYEIIKNVQET
ncbi:MAG: chromosomal replication initiator protein DnaA [Clostridiales bacterium]|nr:chromosomal replication initiator protein DnaA [Clostridiales bacterium]